MTNTMQVQTINGLINFEVMHKNGALQVVKSPTQDPRSVFYNTVHNNGLKIPITDTGNLADAIIICDWCVENFPELAKEIVVISKSRQKEFCDRLYVFRFVRFEDWGNDD